MSTACPECGGKVSGADAVCPECLKRVALFESVELEHSAGTASVVDLLPESAQERPDRGLAAGSSLDPRPQRDRTMPRILVTTEPIDKPDAGVMLDEKVATSDLASNHFADQLIERIGWAIVDAEGTEHHSTFTTAAPRGA